MAPRALSASPLPSLSAADLRIRTPGRKPAHTHLSWAPMPDSPAQSAAPTVSSPARIIALMNQKGGVGKTTTTVNLAAGIAQSGRRVLVVDLDPQAHASLHLGVYEETIAERPEGTPRSAYDVLLDPTLDARAALYPINDNLSVLPAETDLAALETELSELDPAERTTRLRKVLQQLTTGPNAFDYVLIDCPPSLGVLTLNGLAAAGEVFIPMQAHFLALQGVSKLLETVSLVCRSVNPSLKVTGVILCMHDPSSTHSREVVQDLVTFFEGSKSSGKDVPWSGASVLQPPIRRNIKLAECPSFGKTIFDYAPFCPGALDYKALADGVIKQWESSRPKSETKAAPVVKTRRPSQAPAEAGA
jgi:chromosome partitioning protein